MRKYLRLMLIVVIVIGVATPFIVARFKKKSSAVTYKTEQVAKGTLTATVSGSGNIVVHDSVNVNPSISGTVENARVSVGDKVKKGQTLFSIKNDQLDITVQKANTSYVQAKQSLVNAQAAYDAAKVTYETQTGSVAKAKTLATLEKAKLTLVQSQSQLTKDQTALSASPSDAELLQKVAVDQATIETNQDDIDSAQLAYDQIVAGTGSAVKTAKAQLNAAKTSVDVAKQGVASALADLNDQKETAAERTVTAPINGTVTALSVANGDTLGSGAASSASSASTASNEAVIQDLSTLKAVVSINEVDIADVAVGQKATMTFDAISDQSLTGKVEKVDTAGTASQGVVTYSATIGFDSLSSKVRPEMSVNAVITTNVKQDVLCVTSTAVKSQSDGTSYVQVMVDGTPASRTVTTGVSSDTATEITSGLSEGDTVVTQTITSSSSSSNTNSSSTRRSDMPGFVETGGPSSGAGVIMGR
ncbi:MAG: efflux RND transporter periplasmic adaptor subunit [Candidatus Kerfeldbacteria bacterium]